MITLLVKLKLVISIRSLFLTLFKARLEQLTLALGTLVNTKEINEMIKMISFLVPLV